MADTHKWNPTLQSLFHALDPVSLILSQNSNPHEPALLKLTSQSFAMERGPRYSAYAKLRESKLRMKNWRQQQDHEHEVFKQIPPAKKQPVKFQNVVGNERRGSSVFLTRSVQDLSTVIRKENKKPYPSAVELTPPKNWERIRSSLSSSRGSKSANAGEKKGGVLSTRKSYANLAELKVSSMKVANDINGESRGGGRGWY